MGIRQFIIMAAANLGNFERFKKPNPPSPSIASSEDLVDLRRKDLMAKPLSAEDVRHHRVFDAKTEAELRRKRAEREMWLDEACRNFVHGVVDAASVPSEVASDVNVSNTSSSSDVSHVDPPPPSPASSYATSPRPQIEVQKLMESLHGLELDGTPTYQDLSKMVPLTPEELGPRMKKISISKSFLQMLHSAQDYDHDEGGAGI